MWKLHEDSLNSTRILCPGTPMQFEHIKKRIIAGLIEEMASIGATELELAGHAVVQLIEGKRLVHHGLNTDYRPVGYTVDTFSQDGTVVAEYSTDKSYFTDSSKKGKPAYFKKIFTDIEHALGHSNPKKIYLLTSQEEPESFRQKFLQTQHGKNYSDRLEILDGRELAKRIYEFCVKSQSDASFFADFFPDFAMNLDNYEYYGRVPSRCENHQSEEVILDSIRKHHATGRSVCVLHGLSGTGKTQAAIDYVHQTVDKIGNYIWIYGEDWKKDTSLSSIKRSRGGTPLNVAGAFNSIPTLLVVDNLERTVDPSTFAELEPGLKAGGVILVTSTLNLPGSDTYVATPPLTFEIATKVLGEQIDKLSGTAYRFIEACRFSPLILATARSIFKSKAVDKEAFMKEALDKPDLLSKQDGTSIMKSLLQKLEKDCFEGLVKIANSGSGRHDSRFLANFIGQNISITLQRLSLLQSATAPGLLKVHDLICDAVRVKSNFIPVSDAIECFIAERAGEMLPSVIREIHLCADQLLETHRARGQRKPDWLMYALMQVDTGARGEVESGLAVSSISNDCTMPELRCIVDAKEGHAYSIDSNDKRQEYYKHCAAEYQAAIDAGVREELKVELLHHRGKALRRSGSFIEALACFTELLSYRPDWHAAHGQIAHLGTQKDASKDIKAAGEISMRWLVEKMLSDYSSVPLRVSLAAIARLRSYPSITKEIQAEPTQVEQISHVIAISALEGLDQFYEAFVAFTSKFAYAYGEVCIALADALPELLAIPPESIDKRQWVSACEALINISQAAASVDNLRLADRMRTPAMAFVSAIVGAGFKDAYSVRVVMKAYLAARMPKEALSYFDLATSGGTDHWLLYRKSQALLDLGRPEDALGTGREALELAKNELRDGERLASYYDQLSKCAEEANDLSFAASYCSDAINCRPTPKYMQQLKERMALLEARLKVKQ